MCGEKDVACVLTCAFKKPPSMPRKTAFPSFPPVLASAVGKIWSKSMNVEFGPPPTIQVLPTGLTIGAKMADVRNCQTGNLLSTILLRMCLLPEGYQ